MKTYIGGRRRSEGLLFHWYTDLLLTVIVASVLAELIFRSPLGSWIIGFEKYSIMRVLRHYSIGVVDSGVDRFIVYGSGRIFTVIIVPVCTGIYGVVAFILFSQLLPFIERRDKLIALLIYAPALFAFNVARIVLGIYIGLHYGLEAFTVYHGTLSTIMTIIIYAILWTHWFYKSTMKLRAWEEAGSLKKCKGEEELD